MYYLYHIKGVKWGCSNQLKIRLKNQGYSFCNVEDIIAVVDVNEASEMEKLLNKQYGYKGDFINQDPISVLKDNPEYFDYIDKDSSTKKYIEVMTSLIKKTNN